MLLATRHRHRHHHHHHENHHPHHHHQAASSMFSVKVELRLHERSRLSHQPAATASQQFIRRHYLTAFPDFSWHRQACGEVSFGVNTGLILSVFFEHVDIRTYVVELSPRPAKPYPSLRPACGVCTVECVYICRSTWINISLPGIYICMFPRSAYMSNKRR